MSFQFTLDPVFEADNRDKQREVEVYVNRGVLISHSIFRLNETVTLKFEKTTLALKFTLHSGEGDFVGQVAHGNRPNQVLKGEAFDQILSLRTLRRSSEAILKLDIQIT